MKVSCSWPLGTPLGAPFLYEKLVNNSILERRHWTKSPPNTFGWSPEACAFSVKQSRRVAKSSWPLTYLVTYAVCTLRRHAGLLALGNTDSFTTDKTWKHTHGKPESLDTCSEWRSRMAGMSQLPCTLCIQPYSTLWNGEKKSWGSTHISNDEGREDKDPLLTAVPPSESIVTVGKQHV